MRKNVASAKSLENHNLAPRQPITLYMIGMELENDLIDLQSRFARGITKVYGIIQKLLFIKSR